MAVKPSSKELLDHLGRMLLSRSLQFKKAYGIGDLVTADKHGYFGIDPSYANEIFSPKFFDLLEEYLRKGGLPAKRVLLEELKSSGILLPDSPLERTCFSRFPSFLARRRKGEFVDIVAECLPICFYTLNRNKFREDGGAGEFPARDSEKNGDRLCVVHERAIEPGGKLRTGQNRTPNKRIRVESQLNANAQQQIRETLGGVIRELLEGTRRAETW